MIAESALNQRSHFSSPLPYVPRQDLLLNLQVILGLVWLAKEALGSTSLHPLP